MRVCMCVYVCVYMYTSQTTALQKKSCQIRHNAYVRTTIVRFRSFLVYILYGFLYTEGANKWGQVLVCCMQLS